MAIKQLLSSHPRHRSVYLLAGEANWQDKELKRIFSPACQGIWLGEEPRLTNFTCIPDPQIKQKLGQETDNIIIDASNGLNPNSIGIAAGLVTGGGKCVFLLPEKQPWFLQNNRHVKKLLSYPLALEDSLKGFNQHFWFSFDRQTEQKNCSAETTEQNTSLPTLDQQQAIEAMLHVANGHSKRPLVLLADRGRGKSYALGLAARSILSQNNKQRILITSAHKQQTETVFKAFHSFEEKNDEKYPLPPPDKQQALSFIAPDTLLVSRQPCDLVMVDEAATLPVPLLMQIVQTYPRVVFASTTHGYEGSGRGFGIALFKQLNQHFPHWKLSHLKQPIRWAENDPLEMFVNQLLMTQDSLPPAEPSKVQIDLNKLKFQEVDTSTLASDSKKLKAIFQLLVSAHYQTTPNDLLQLLEAPNLQLVTMSQQDQLLGVLLAVKEGGLDFSLDYGRRRQGHLVPQLLASQTANESWLQLNSLRVQRIAVQPEYQNQGLGKALLKHWIALNQDQDYLATSFGATKELVNFWQDFQPLHFGLKKDKASGHHSIIMVLPLSEKTQQLCKQTQSNWRQQWQLLLMQELQNLPNDLVQAVTQLTGFEKGAFPDGYKQGQAYEAISHALRNWLLSKLDRQNAIHPLLIDKVIKNKSWLQLSQDYQLSQKQLRSELLQACLSLAESD